MTERQFIDAWFQMLAIPSQVYLYWVREMHQHARPASVYLAAREKPRPRVAMRGENGGEIVFDGGSEIKSLAGVHGYWIAE